MHVPIDFNVVSLNILLHSLILDSLESMIKYILFMLRQMFGGHLWRCSGIHQKKNNSIYDVTANRTCTHTIGDWNGDSIHERKKSR